MSKITRRGLMLVLSSPSGAGKTTLSRRLLQETQDLFLSISHTTRAPRPGEKEGEDYYFITEEKFSVMVQEASFLEHAPVFGCHYGTLKEPVEASLKQGKDVLFDIDWQGTQQLKEKARSDVVSIFILPPDWLTLEQRLVSRGKDSPDIISFRMSKAKDEMKHWAEYDYVLINEDLACTVSHIQAILKAERVRRDRQLGLSEFVNEICGPDFMPLQEARHKEHAS